jgi:hypothetical protein
MHCLAAPCPKQNGPLTAGPSARYDTGNLGYGPPSRPFRIIGEPLSSLFFALEKGGGGRGGILDGCATVQLGGQDLPNVSAIQPLARSDIQVRQNHGQGNF